MGMPSAGVWVLMKRRWVCAPSRAISLSKSKMRRGPEHRPISFFGPRKVAVGPQQRGDYRLHPRRAALGRRAHEDVTWAMVVGGPPGAVDERRSIYLLLRPHPGLVFLCDPRVRCSYSLLAALFNRSTTSADTSQNSSMASAIL